MAELLELFAGATSGEASADVPSISAIISFASKLVGTVESFESFENTLEGIGRRRDEIIRARYSLGLLKRGENREMLVEIGALNPKWSAENIGRRIIEDKNFPWADNLAVNQGFGREINIRNIRRDGIQKLMAKAGLAKTGAQISIAQGILDLKLEAFRAEKKIESLRQSVT